MPIFILGALIIGVIAWFALLWPLLRRGPAAAVEQSAVLAVYRQRATELEQQQALGQIDPEEFREARAELECAMARDLKLLTTQAEPGPRPQAAWFTALAALLAGTVLSLQLYERLGGYGPASAANQAAAERASQLIPVAELEQRLKHKLDDIDGWWLLGRSYIKLQMPHDAARALAHAYSIAPDNPELAFDYARALADAQEGKLAGAPERVIDKAAALFPNEPRVLWLAAMAALERGDRADGLAKFDQLIAAVDPASEDATRLKQLRDQIVAEGGEAPAPADPGAQPVAVADSTTTAQAGVNSEPAITAAPPQAATSAEPATPTPAASTTASVRVRVVLDSAISANAAPEDTVFIFAKAIDGPPMPLAVARVQVKDLPAEVNLDDTQAMAPQFKLSAFPEVAIGARVSKTGRATASSGDLDGYAELPVDPHSANAFAEVLIKNVVP